MKIYDVTGSLILDQKKLIKGQNELKISIEEYS